MAKPNKERSVRDEVVEQPQVQEEVVVVQEPVADTPKVPVKETVTPKQPVKEPKPVSSSSGEIKTPDDINAILEDGSLDIEAKLKKIATSGAPIARFAEVMMDYNRKLGNDAPTPEPKTIAAANYNLYTRLAKVCKTEDYEDFRIFFDVVNHIFYHYRKDAFDMYKLTRYDNLWTWGDKQLKTYINLTSLICALCDKSNRKSASVSVSLNKVLDLDTTAFTETMVNNIRKYYDL